MCLLHLISLTLRIYMLKYGTVQSSVTPAPEIEIEVSSPTDPLRRATVICIVDTAATVSVLPRQVIASLQPLDYRKCRIQWGSGDVASNRWYCVDLKLGPVRFPELWVVTNEKEYGLIGRDLLNTHLLLCNGPERRWRVEPSWL